VGSAAVNTLTCARRGSTVCPHRSAAAASSTTAVAADHVFLLTTEPPAWTTRTPMAAATRSSSSRNSASVSTANTPAEPGVATRVFAVTRSACGAVTFAQQCPRRICGERRECAQRRLFGARSAYGSHDPRNAQKATPIADRPTNLFPRKGTTPARGGGGEGRRVSAPGGRADTPSAQAEYCLLYT
jgi:hypothetical protein